MPKELPGFYFDAEKNRYFPSSSKPDVRATNHQHTHKPLSLPKSLSRTCHRSPSVWHAIQRSRLAKHQRERIATTQSVSLATTSYPNSYWSDASAK
ncbi:hypothetical protein EDB83DRAFT_2340185 [Lactarius deliciosus]|nr:hypothetical protein EDB83DRAFT_2340185 [Lactarius deliciosus]